MSRNLAGIYAVPPGSTAVDNTIIDPVVFNTLISDLEADANTARPVVAGGTGATTAAAARTNLGATATGSALFTAADVVAVMALLNSALVGGNPFRWIGPGAVGSRLMIALGTASTTTSGVTVTFPLSFSSAPYIQVTPIVSTTPLFGTYQSPGASSFVAQTWDAVGTQTAGSVSWLAAGAV